MQHVRQQNAQSPVVYNQHLLAKWQLRPRVGLIFIDILEKGVVLFLKLLRLMLLHRTLYLLCEFLIENCGHYRIPLLFLQSSVSDLCLRAFSQVWVLERVGVSTQDLILSLLLLFKSECFVLRQFSNL